MDTLVPLVAAVVGGFVVYLLSGRRAQMEWRFQKRAEVLAGIYERLSKVETTATMATLPGVALEAREQRISQNRKALEELVLYLHAHSIWMDAGSFPTIREFVEGLSSAFTHYEVEIHKGTPDSALAVGAAEHIQRIVPEAEQVLEAEFRLVVYPPPWWEYLLRGLEWVQARNRKTSGNNSGARRPRRSPIE